MTVLIPYQPDDDRGEEILNELENRYDLWPQRVKQIGKRDMRRYRLDDENADIDALEPRLDAIDSGWRDHLTNWRDD